MCTFLLEISGPAQKARGLIRHNLRVLAKLVPALKKSLEILEKLSKDNVILIRAPIIKLNYSSLSVRALCARVCCAWNICPRKSQRVAADLRPVARRLCPALNLLDGVLPGVWVLPGHQHGLKTAHEPCTDKHVQREQDGDDPVLLQRISRPKMGVARFSTRETVEGSPATMHTIPSKKVEWGATARIGASLLLTWVPFTTTRKPMQKK